PGVTRCATSGTAFDTENLSGAVATPPTYTVTSKAFTPTAVGTYCFAASWPGDTNYTGGPFRDGGTNECFTVQQIPTTTVTTPSPPSVTFGSTVTDHAVITATKSGDGAVTGSAAFFVCNPSQVSAGACATAGPAVGSPVSVTP